MARDSPNGGIWSVTWLLSIKVELTTPPPSAHCTLLFSFVLPLLCFPLLVFTLFEWLDVVYHCSSMVSWHVEYRVGDSLPFLLYYSRTAANARHAECFRNAVRRGLAGNDHSHTGSAHAANPTTATTTSR